MAIVVIIVMCAVAVGVSVSRINALRARNRAEREAEQSRTPQASGESAPASEQGRPHASFADYLDAENSPTLTRAQMDEWRRDFVLACKYGRRPRTGKAPFMQYLRAEGFSLPYKSSMPTDRAAKCNEKALRFPLPQSLSARCKTSYKAYSKSDEPAGIMR